MSSETAETYLRQFAETLLRGLATGTLSFSDCRLRMDGMSAAFESAGVLATAVTSEISGGLNLALVARGVTVLGPRLPRNLSQPLPQVAPAAATITSGETVIVPAGAAFQIGGDGQANGKPTGVPDEQVYLLSYLAASGRAWLNVAARSSVPPAPRQHASPPSSRVALPGTTGTSARIARPSTFAGGGLTAADNTGQRYRLSFSGGGGTWYLGRLALTPAPPPGLEWLDVTCGEQTARLDLTARVPEASIKVSPREVSPAEAFLLRQAETLLFHPAHARAGTATLADIVPAFRAIGAIPESSPVPGQITALCERLGVPAAAIAAPGDLPGRWAAILAHRGTPSPVGAPPAPAGPAFQAAHLVAMLPEADGIAISLGGLITRPGAGTVVFGALEPRSALRVWQERTSMWLADDAGGWHAVTVSGWASTSGGYHTFQADVEPPLGPETTAVEFFVTGPETEVRAALPLTWWIS